MNFLKKVFFGATKQQLKATGSASSSKSQDQEEVPIEILSELFQKSAKYISESSKPIPDQHKLTVYGLYKQATVGDCNTPKPSMLDFVGKSKWNAWNNNSGMSKLQAMKVYISKAVQIDPQIEKKMQSFLEEGKEIENQQSKQKQKVSSALSSGTGLKIIEQKDYSEEYSHPYFKLIQKNLPIQDLSRQLLLQKNNSPKCYPLHFAIDKERVDLVKQFLSILEVGDIQMMQDEDGNGIEEYGQLIENQEIIELIKQKLGNF